MNHMPRYATGALFVASLLIGFQALAAVSPVTHEIAPKLPEVPASLAPLPRGSEALYTQLDARVPARLRPWLAQEALKISLGQTDGYNWPSPNDPMLAGLNLSITDIDALVFIVMMDAAKNSQDDLKTILAEIKAQNAAKQRLRSQISQMHGAASNTVQPSASPSPTSKKLDSLSDLDQTNQLKLQMMNDRRDKILKLLSNLMFKVDAARDSVIQNIK